MKKNKIIYSIFILLLFTTYSSSALAQTSSKAFLSTAINLAKMHKWSDLEIFTRKQIKLTPNDSKAWEFLGISLGNLNIEHESLKSFEKAYDIDPHDPSICMNLGISYAKNSEQRKLIKLIKSFKRENIIVAVKLLDRDEVFELINTSGMVQVSKNRASEVVFPKMGPFPAFIVGKYFNDAVMTNGFAVFEAFVSPDGSITKCNGLAGLEGHITAAKSFVEKIKFPKLEPNNLKTERVRVVMYFDVGERPDGDYLKIHRMGIGFSMQEAVQNAIDVPQAGSTPRLN